MIVYGENVKIQIPALLYFYNEKYIFNERNFKLIEEFNSNLEEKFNLYYIDIESYDNLVKTYNIKYYPTIIIFNSKAKEIYRFTGEFKNNLDLYIKRKNGKQRS